ncbi:MAG: protein O-GlcNAcase [Sulfolobales archaeon]
MLVILSRLVIVFGIVEGFYGTPWNWLDRIYMIEFLGRLGFDTYIYAPKWDPMHRDWWRDPYTPEFLDRLSMLVSAANRYGVRVVFALSPGLDIDYSSNHDVRILLRKLQKIMEHGIEDLAIFLDDVPPILRGRGYRSLAEAQASLVNKIYGELEPRALVFCPTYYYGLKDDYLSELGSLVDPGIHIIWTGMWVASHKISEEDLEAVSRLIKRKPFIWDNYPVNDYFIVNGITRLHLGAIRNRPSNMPRLVSGYVSNPANQPEASKIPLYTISNILFEKTYDPERSISEAVDAIVNKSARHWFKRFLEYNKASFMDLDEETITKNNAEEALEIARELRETLYSKKLLREIEPVLDKMEAIARYARGETRILGWRTQTAGEYNPPITSERMVKEIFGIVARKIPWYVEAYRKPEQ